MDGPKMLSGSQLVAKGATKKVDGQLPEVGLKDVSRNGSWLEQKQIQSALEARKHLIAVERIEKSGSISHAVWRDDLKLAEVTKQTGGHWQYMGHQRGKYLYLLPEEALFLMETNSLLLKHNDVTVSLQKAYPLCLSDMSNIQYKVYASLSRLGYRVFRHKEPTNDDSNRVQATDEDIENTNTPTEEYLEVCVKIDQANSESRSIVSNDSNNMEVIENNASATATDDTNNLTNNIYPDNIPENNEGATNKEISLNGNDSTTMDNSIKTDRNTEKIDHNTVIVNDKTSEQDEGKTALPTVVTDNVNESNVNESVTISGMDINDNPNETMVTTNANEDTPATVFEASATVSDETSNPATLAYLYSIDEFGVIRAIEQNAPMETDSTESNVINAGIDSTDNDPKYKDSSTNNSFKSYHIELKHYDDKIKKLKERKSFADQKNNQGLDTLQDLYRKQIVKVNVPEEKYLPRNIFLHKAEYTLNMDVVRNQNASNVTNDDTDSLESSSSTAAQNMNSQRLSDLPRFGTFHNSQPRYPVYQHQRQHYNPRLNFNNYSIRNLSGYYGHHSRYHQNAYLRQHYMVYNVNMPGANNYRNHLNRQDTIKKYHFETIVNIAMRLKNSIALPTQVRALQNLLNTYNLRYDTRISVTPDFNVIGTPDSVPDQKVIVQDEDKVIALDDEPKRKKPRLNDENVKYNSNVVKLKELAAKLKELQAKNLAVSRHRRVFSNAIKTFNNKFNAELYLDSNFDIVDRKTVVVDTSSDSEAVVVKEKEKTKKRKKLRNPYSILKCISKDVNVGASTSKQVPVLRKLSFNVINDSASQNTSDNAIIDSITIDDKDDDLLNSFYSARFPGNDDFSGAKLCSRFKARLDALLFQTEYLYDVLKESLAEFESWADIKLTIWKDIRETLNLQRQQVEAMSNDLFTNVSEIQPILGPDCTDLRSALKKLAIIPSDKDVPSETSLRIHFDVCNRDVHFRKSNPPKPNFRVVCYDESAPFPSAEDVVALQGKYTDGIPTVFAFVGTSGSISYLQINSIDLPVFIQGSDLA